MGTSGQKLLQLVDANRSGAKLKIDGRIVLPEQYSYNFKHNYTGPHEFVIELVDGKLEILHAMLGDPHDYYYCKNPQILFVNDKVWKIKTECAERLILAMIRISPTKYKYIPPPAREEKIIKPVEKPTEKPITIKEEEKPTNNIMLLIVLLASGLGLYYLWKRRKR
jgi:hypothetical protein